MELFLKDLPAILLMGAGFVAVFLVSGLIYRINPEKKEISRKAAHLGCGLIALAFPFFIHQAWEVGVMCLSFFIFLVVTKISGSLNEIHGIGRKSLGAFLYPAAVFLTYILTSGKPNLYVASILVLSVSDTAAALVGKKFGRIGIPFAGGKKTLEGFAAFIVTAFVCVDASMTFLYGMTSGNAALTALIVSVLTGLIELISVSGVDNILIPVSVLTIAGSLSAGGNSAIGWTEVRTILRYFAVGISLYCLCLQILPGFGSSAFFNFRYTFFKRI